REHPDRTCAEHERALELPRLPAADRASMPDRPPADRGRLGEYAEPSERAGDRDQLRGVLGDVLAREAVQARDAAFGVVAGEARVGRPVLARAAVRARAADGRGHEVSGGEAVPAVGDDAEQLVTEHELGSAVGRYAEHALG